MATIVYVLRLFPELTETFVRRELEALESAGNPVRVISIDRSRSASVELLEAVAGPRDVVFLRDRNVSRDERRSERHLWRFAMTVARDCARLKLHPRRTARCLRLAYYALRASRCLPSDPRRLHAHFANDAGALARYLSVLSGVPFAITAHAYDLYQDPYLLCSNLEAAHHVYTVSQTNLDFLLAMAADEGWPKEKFSLLRCGIDLSRFPYRDPPPPATPARLLCVARLVPKKGHAVLLDALAQLVSDDVRWTLQIVGDGPLEAQLQKRASALKLSRHVEFVGGLSPDRVPALMQQSDLVVLASRVADDGDRDGLPVSLVEACALGVPILSTAVSGIPELVTSETGRLVPPDRPDLLARAVRDFLNEPHSRRVARCRKARTVVETHFDVSKQAAILSSN